MRMPRPVTLLLALVLGAGSAGLMACGKSNPHMLSAGRADQVNQALDEVQAAVQEHNCAGATKAVARLDSRLSDLPRDTDPQLQAALQRGAAALAKQALKECAQTNTTPTQTETTPTQTETTPTQTETTPTQTETTPTTTTPTTTTPTTTTPTTTTPTTAGNGGATPTTP